MTWKRRLLLSLAIALSAAVLSGAFWLCWYLSAGNLPTVDSFRPIWSTDWKLPIALSRGLDVPLFGLWAGIITVTILQPEVWDEVENIDIGPTLIATLVVALILGVVTIFAGPVIPMGLAFVIFGIYGGAVAADDVLHWSHVRPQMRLGILAGLAGGVWFGGWSAVLYALPNGMVLGLVVMALFAMASTLGAVLGSLICTFITAWSHDSDSSEPEPEPKPAVEAEPDPDCPGGMRPEWMDS